MNDIVEKGNILNRMGRHTGKAEDVPLFSTPWATRSSLLLKQKWCLPTATARLRLKLGLHPNRPLRTNRAAQTISYRELQNLDVLLSLKAEVGAADTSVPAGLTFWACWHVVRGAHQAAQYPGIWVRDQCIVFWYGLSNSSALGPGKGKASRPELTDLTNLQDKGHWSLVSTQSRRRSLTLAPEVPLCNRYDALGLEKMNVWVMARSQERTTLQSWSNQPPVLEPVQQKIPPNCKGC